MLTQPDLWAARWPVDPTRVPHKPVKQPIWLSLALAKHGERVWADDGEDHVGSARLAYADAGIYRWLLQFVR